MGQKLHQTKDIFKIKTFMQKMKKKKGTNLNKIGHKPKQTESICKVEDIFMQKEEILNN